MKGGRESHTAGMSQEGKISGDSRWAMIHKWWEKSRGDKNSKLECGRGLSAF